MATVKRQNICVGTKYTDAGGQEKTRWTTIGKAFHSDKGGISIKIETIPVGNWDGFAQLFDEQDRQQGTQQSAYQQQGFQQPAYQPTDFYAQQRAAAGGMQPNPQFMPPAGQQAPMQQQQAPMQQQQPMGGGMPFPPAGGFDNAPF